MLHVVPSWQSAAKHVRLKHIMADRPDLIESELSGLAFEALEQAFRKQDIDKLLTTQDLGCTMNEDIHIFVDPAAGGPSSDYGILSVVRSRGMMVVRALLPLR
jgi:hypothetical protein